MGESTEEDLTDVEYKELLRATNTWLASQPDEKEPGRNDPCPCGSGKKYKKCCMEGVAIENLVNIITGKEVV